jgi:exonuclease III
MKASFRAGVLDLFRNSGIYPYSAIFERMCWDRWWNHSDVVRLLEDRGIVSLYHKMAQEAQGQESKPSFFLHRNPAKPYHIDYCFASREIADRCRRLEIGKFSDWIYLSDHCPIFVDLEL